MLRQVEECTAGAVAALAAQLGRRGCGALAQAGAVAALLDLLNSLPHRLTDFKQRFAGTVCKRVCTALAAIAARHPPSRNLMLTRCAIWSSNLCTCVSGGGICVAANKRTSVFPEVRRTVLSRWMINQSQLSGLHMPQGLWTAHNLQ